MVQIRDNKEFDIILLLLRNPLHVRGIAKGLHQPHATILRKANSLVEQKVLDYKREGKNKVFFLRSNMVAVQYTYLAEHNKLVKLLAAYPEIAVIMNDILKKCREKLIILFGSYAKFQAKPDSDIDLYVDTTKRKCKETIEAIHSKLSVQIGRFDAKNNLIKEIMKNHVILRGVEDYYENKNDD